jgi:hypothetical protein
VRYLLRKGLEANSRSRYVHLAWALWEKRQGQLEDARRLFERGCKLNPCDAALRQVRRRPRAPPRARLTARPRRPGRRPRRLCDRQPCHTAVGG